MATMSCDLNCNNGGYCSIYPFDSTGTALMPVDGSLHQICVCPYGFTGLTCLETTEELDLCHRHGDTHVCRSGGVCKPVIDWDLDEEKESRCDCAIADAVNAFAGAMCRRPATEYCNIVKSEFCTNGGTCKSNLVKESLRTEGSGICMCPPEFTGPHCEFLKFLVDRETNLETVDLSLSERSDDISTGAVNHGRNIGIVAGVGALLLAAAFFVRRRKKTKDGLYYNGGETQAWKPEFPVEDLNNITMDADRDYQLESVALT